MPWNLISPQGEPIVSFLRPYILLVHEGTEHAHAHYDCPAWAYVLAKSLWFDTDVSQGATRQTVVRALAWAGAQPDPVEASRALVMVHMNATRGNGGKSVRTYLDALGAPEERREVPEYHAARREHPARKGVP